MTETLERIAALGLPIEPDFHSEDTPCHYTFVGDRLTEVVLSGGHHWAKDVLPKLADLLALGPVEVLRLLPYWASLRDNSYISENLSGPVPPLTRDDLADVFMCPGVPGLAVLDLRGAGLDDPAADDLIASPLAAGRVGLHLGDLTMYSSDARRDIVVTNPLSAAARARLGSAFPGRVSWTPGRVSGSRTHLGIEDDADQAIVRGGP